MCMLACIACRACVRCEAKKVVCADSGVTQAEEPREAPWHLGLPFSVETKEGHAEASMSPRIMPNALRKPSNVLQVLATPAWPV